MIIQNEGITTLRYFLSNREVFPNFVRKRSIRNRVRRFIAANLTGKELCLITVKIMIEIGIREIQNSLEKFIISVLKNVNPTNILPKVSITYENVIGGFTLLICRKL
jgi:hypothetical protein